MPLRHAADAAEDRAGDDPRARLERLQLDVVAVEPEDAVEVAAEVATPVDLPVRWNPAGAAGGRRVRAVRVARTAAPCSACRRLAGAVALATLLGALRRAWRCSAPWRPRPSSSRTRARPARRRCVGSLSSRWTCAVGRRPAAWASGSAATTDFRCAVRVGVAVDVLQDLTKLPSRRLWPMSDDLAVVDGDDGRALLGEDLDPAAAVAGLDDVRPGCRPCCARGSRSAMSSA